MQTLKCDGFVIKWRAPQLKDDVIALFETFMGDDDNKEEQPLPISYNILYCNINEEKKEEDEWNVISILGKENEYEYDMAEYTPCKAAIEYKINNILKSAVSAPVTVAYTARWSSQYKGDRIALSEGNTKALMAESDEQTVRAQYPIKKGMIVKLNYTFYTEGGLRGEIVGVASSEFVDYAQASIPFRGGEIGKYCYGADCYYGYENKHYFGGYKDLGWSLGEFGQK
eukprot:UN11786